MNKTYNPNFKVKRNIRFGQFANDRSVLNRKLYLICRELAGNERDDTEVVKIIRDNYIAQKFAKSYKELSLKELRDAINDLKPPRKDKSTPEQRKLFNFYAVSVALIYHNFEKLQYVNLETAEILESERLREYCFDLFRRDLSIPKPILRELFDNYINPKANEFLIEGEYKTVVKSKKNVIYYEKLYKDEMNYLIIRFSKIFNEKSKSDIPKMFHNN